jgi:hypothetical protein
MPLQDNIFAFFNPVSSTDKNVFTFNIDTGLQADHTGRDACATNITLWLSAAGTVGS